MRIKVTTARYTATDTFLMFYSEAEKWFQRTKICNLQKNILWTVNKKICSAHVSWMRPIMCILCFSAMLAVVRYKVTWQNMKLQSQDTRLQLKYFFLSWIWCVIHIHRILQGKMWHPHSIEHLTGQNKKCKWHH